MNYYTINEPKGKLNVSVNVFVQIALDTLNALSKHQLENLLVLPSNKAQNAVKVLIDGKNHVNVNVSFLVSPQADAKTVANTIQKAVYDAIYEATEFSNVKVNVSLLGFAAPKTEK